MGRLTLNLPVQAVVVQFALSLLWPAVSLPGREADTKTHVCKMRPPAQDARALEIDLPEGVEPKLEQMSDFAGYRCCWYGEKKELIAMMMICITQFPGSLRGNVGSNYYVQDLAQFKDGRETWFTWEEKGQDKLGWCATVDLNNLYRNSPNPGRAYVVQITIQADDYAMLQKVKAMAQTVRVGK